jgi:hypothetical protein
MPRCAATAVQVAATSLILLSATTTVAAVVLLVLRPLVLWLCLNMQHGYLATNNGTSPNGYLTAVD